MKLFIILLLAGTFLLAACSRDQKKNSLINDEASLPESLQLSTAGLKTMAFFIDKKSGSMSVLYANQLAINNAGKKNAGLSDGERMALVTWKQKSDSSWFGARVPGKLRSVELINTGIDSTAGLTTHYKIYVEGKLWPNPGAKYSKDRVAFILHQLPFVMP
jgi:hypothetical protein